MKGLITGRKAKLPDVPTNAEPESRRHWSSYIRGTRKERGVMNKTETEFAETVLDIRLAAGEITQYWYEAVTLKLTDKTPGGRRGIRYTADFMVWLDGGGIELFEVKGTGVSTTADLNRVKLAADKYPFRFFVATKQTKADGGGFKIEEY
jgi:hypothetical protein